MLQQPLEVHVRWARRAGDATLRTRLEAELRPLAWTLSQMEALLHDAHRAASMDHAFLLPRMELRLPIYDLGRRFRVVLTCVGEKVEIEILDEDGARVADVLLF